MVSIEEMQKMLEDIAAELPEDFFRDLNGGIILLPDTKSSAAGGADDLFVLGEYRQDVHLGRFISIYYGSFVRVFGHLHTEELREQLKITVKHEFRHHLEHLGGEWDLDIEDAQFIADYESKRNRDKQ